jgi:hypothetical protein
VCAEHGGDLLKVAAGGDDGVTSGQGGFGDVHAHPPAGAGDEPDLLLTHAGCTSLVSILSISVGTRRLSGGASATEPRVGLKRESLMMGLLTGTLSTGGAPVG